MLCTKEQAYLSDELVFQLGLFAVLGSIALMENSKLDVPIIPSAAIWKEVVTACRVVSNPMSKLIEK